MDVDTDLDFSMCQLLGRFICQFFTIFPDVLRRKEGIFRPAHAPTSSKSHKCEKVLCRQLWWDSLLFFSRTLLFWVGTATPSRKVFVTFKHSVRVKGWNQKTAQPYVNPAESSKGLCEVTDNPAESSKGFCQVGLNPALAQPLSSNPRVMKGLNATLHKPLQSSARVDP